MQAPHQRLPAMPRRRGSRRPRLQRMPRSKPSVSQRARGRSASRPTLASTRSSKSCQSSLVAVASVPVNRSASVVFTVVPLAVVPDNWKTAVNRACRYMPEVNVTYQEMAAHYGVAVVPARPRKPRDKAKAEAGVLLVERWILAVLRKRVFFSLADLPSAIVASHSCCAVARNR